MKSAYNDLILRNLLVVKESRDWAGQGVISQEQHRRITEAYPSGFFHPNFFIRILLFVASLIALGGVTGLLILFFEPDDETTFSFFAVVYGVISLVILERVFIRNMNHYKSGVNEALIYHSAVFIVTGIAGFFDFSEAVLTPLIIVAALLVAYRYIDIIASVVAFLAVAYWIFSSLNEWVDWLRHLIPIAFVLVYSGVYFAIRKIRSGEKFELWDNCLLVMEAGSLLLIYAAGNYFVVRELTVSMFYYSLTVNNDIPFAWVFYALTVVIPFLYLYFAIKTKDIVLLRVSLFVLAFSVFTFKYYFSLGHPEVTFTISGIILLLITVMVYRFLKIPRGGFTHEKLLSEKWADANPEAFVISQTMGGNRVVADEGFKGEGGSFGGGGASGSY